MKFLDKYIIARWAYSQGKPIISDFEYDAMHKIIVKSYAPINPAIKEYSERTWSDDPCPSELLGKYRLFDLMTKEKIIFYEKGESIESVREESELDSLISKSTGMILVSPKINGWSTRYQFIDGNLAYVKSRARENNSEMDFSPLVGVFNEKYNTKKLKEHRFTGTIFGEAYLTYNNYNRLKEVRSVTSQVAGVIAAIKNEPSLIDVRFFNIEEKYKIYKNKLEKRNRLIELGVETVEYQVTIPIMLKTSLKNIKRENYDYLTDGIVVDLEDSTIKAIRMYDYKSRLYQSKVIGLEESFNSRYIDLKLLIEPVVTAEGSIQRKISIDNLARLKEFGLTYGSTVLFEKISDTTEKISELTKEANNDKQKEFV